MNRNFDKSMDSNGALRSSHATIKHLLHCAGYALQNEQFEDLADIYNRISMLASSLCESAEIRQYEKEEHLRAVRESHEIMQEVERQLTERSAS